MTKLPEKEWVVKIRPEDWSYCKKNSLSHEAKEILLCINHFIELSKINSNDPYWDQITIQQLVELTELSVDQINDAFDELISKNILEKTNNIITLTTERCVHSAGGHSHA